jgi:hypothetical protein
LIVALLAAVQTLAFLMGAMLALGLAGLATHPLLVLLARRHKAWDATHDLIFFLSGFALAAVIYSANIPGSPAQLAN